jgi:hypothetical protein
MICENTIAIGPGEFQYKDNMPSDNVRIRSFPVSQMYNMPPYIVRPVGLFRYASVASILIESEKVPDMPGTPAITVVIFVTTSVRVTQ